MMMNFNNCYDFKMMSLLVLIQINDDLEVIWEQFKVDINSGGWSFCVVFCVFGQFILFGSFDCNVNYVIKFNKEDKFFDFGDYGVNYSIVLIKVNKNFYQKRVIGLLEGG